MRRIPALLLFCSLALVSCQQESADAGSTQSSATTETLSADLRALAEAGDADGVVELLQARAEPLSVEESLLLARARVAQNELPKAIKVLKSTLVEHPDSLDHSLLLARVYTSIKQDELAVAVLEAAHEAGGDSGEFLVEFGLAHGRVGDLERARELLMRAKEKGVVAGEVDYNLALIFMESDRLDQALELLQGIHAESPELLHVRRELAHALFRSDPHNGDAVREHCNVVLEGDAEDWRAWELLGDVELHFADYLASKTYYTKALEFGSKEVGQNPPRVEEKYKKAALALRQEMAEAGTLPEEDDVDRMRRAGPPLPTGFQERARERRRKALEEERGALEGGSDQP